MPTSLGLVGIVDKGVYSSAATYVKGNFVYHNGSTWLLKVATATGIEPNENNSTTWRYLAKGFNVLPFEGATASADGTGGTVPQPLAGEQDNVLFGDGAWDGVIDYYEYASRQNHVISNVSGIPDTTIHTGELIYISVENEHHDIGAYILMDNDVTPPYSVNQSHLKRLSNSKNFIFGEKSFGSAGNAIVAGLVPPIQYSEKDSGKVLQSTGWGHKLQLDVVKQGNEYGYIDISNEFVPFLSIPVSVEKGGTGNTTGYVTAGKKDGTSVGLNCTCEGLGTEASAQQCHAEGHGSKAINAICHAEGYNTTASGAYSHSEGQDTTASGESSHAEGQDTTASGAYSHSEGQYTIASGESSHAEGYGTTASGESSHAEGYGTKASGEGSHAEGISTTASGTYSHAGGKGTVAGPYQYVIGLYNTLNGSSSNKFIIGKGNATTRANSFRVNDSGVYGAGAYNSSGADYAELFEWADGNKNNEDRAGKFVTLDGDKIKFAKPNDDYILGVVSGYPSVVGDVFDDQWQGMFETDIFSRPVYEEVEVEAEYTERENPETGEIEKIEISPKHKEIRQKVNPNYDNTTEYKPRTERQEWDAVGVLGKLVCLDDGTCVVNGYAKVNNDSIATASMKRTKYRVMKRLDESHIQIFIM